MFNKPEIYISTSPFALIDQSPLMLLKAARIPYEMNHLGRKLTNVEMLSLPRTTSVIVAGTEKIDARVLDSLPNLRHIARVGIGLDGVDLNECEARAVTVSYTPEAPSPAVAELTIGLIFLCLRHILSANAALKTGSWNRLIGRRITEVSVGIIGVGRIGGRVIEMLSALGVREIRYFDIRDVDVKPMPGTQCISSTYAEVLKQCDIVSLHVPHNGTTNYLIDKASLEMMKGDAILINTSRGKVINENDLLEHLEKGKLSALALDVFEDEPYVGPLTKFPRCVTTPHLGSMTLDCRARMEIESVADAIRVLRGEPIMNPVPRWEYECQK